MPCLSWLEWIPWCPNFRDWYGLPISGKNWVFPIHQPAGWGSSSVGLVFPIISVVVISQLGPWCNPQIDPMTGGAPVPWQPIPWPGTIGTELWVAIREAHSIPSQIPTHRMNLRTAPFSGLLHFHYYKWLIKVALGIRHWSLHLSEFADQPTVAAPLGTQLRDLGSHAVGPHHGCNRCSAGNWSPGTAGCVWQIELACSMAY